MNRRIRRMNESPLVHCEQTTDTRRARLEIQTRGSSALLFNLDQERSRLILRTDSIAALRDGSTCTSLTEPDEAIFYLEHKVGLSEKCRGANLVGSEAGSEVFVSSSNGVLGLNVSMPH
ncbi:unnamed protein product [Leptosia nina]|uniref:Uncharacterized protein n=1 Tax=Leptosia nina TaxID=320188 RepID=A0AAV1JZ22_9NEOP